MSSTTEILLDEIINLSRGVVQSKVAAAVDGDFGNALKHAIGDHAGTLVGDVLVGSADPFVGFIARLVLAMVTKAMKDDSRVAALGVSVSSLERDSINRDRRYLQAAREKLAHLQHYDNPSTAEEGEFRSKLLQEARISLEQYQGTLLPGSSFADDVRLLRVVCASQEPGGKHYARLTAEPLVTRWRAEAAVLEQKALELTASAQRLESEAATLPERKDVYIPARYSGWVRPSRGEGGFYTDVEPARWEVSHPRQSFIERAKDRRMEAQRLTKQASARSLLITKLERMYD